MQRIGEAPERLRKPAAVALSHFNNELAVFTFRKDSKHGDHEVVGWNLRTHLSHSFHIKLTKDGLPCNYCNGSSGVHHGLMRAWANARHGKILLIFSCFPVWTNFIYVRILQTNLKGQVLYDEHFAFEFYWNEHGEEIVCDVQDLEDSNNVSLSIGVKPVEYKGPLGSVSFELNSATTPPIKPETGYFWFAANPISKSETKCYRYRGIRSSRKVKSEILRDDGTDREREAVNCHCFDGLSLADGDHEDDKPGYNKIGETIKEIKDRTSRVFRTQTRWQLYASKRMGSLFQYAVADISVGLSGSTMELQLFPIQRELASTRAEIGRAFRIKIAVGKDVSKPDNGRVRRRYLRAGIMNMLMDGNFMILQAMLEEEFYGRTETTTDHEVFFVVLSSDPAYVEPQWSATTTESLDIRDCLENQPSLSHGNSQCLSAENSECLSEGDSECVSDGEGGCLCLLCRGRTQQPCTTLKKWKVDWQARVPSLQESVAMHSSSC